MTFANPEYFYLLFLVPLSLEKYRPQLAVLVADKPVKPY